MEWTTFYIITAILILPVFIYGLISQDRVNSVYEKFAQRFSNSGITASTLADTLLKKANISDVDVVKINGKLTDCYDPKNKVVKLSNGVYNSSSIAALGVCAHEIGHAIQHNKKNILFKIRQIIVPITNFISRAFIPLIFIGAILNFTFYIPLVGYYITVISLILYACSLIFYFITLPLEFDASKKALVMLEETSVLSKDEINEARQVLTAAIHTYISAFLSSLIYFLRFLSLIMIFNDRNR